MLYHIDNSLKKTEMSHKLQVTTEAQIIRLGPPVLRADICTTEGPFYLLPEYKIQYPRTVTQALANLYFEYNNAFAPLVEANREWETDYQYCMTGPDRLPTNFFVQVDMVGLPKEYLDAASHLDEEQVRENLRGKIFELENSLAMYQLLGGIFASERQNSLFGTHFRQSLDELRQMHNKPIALLAVTDQKHQAMRESEFGKQDGELLTDEEVKRLSGFDTFFGPQTFCDYLRQNSGACNHLLYVRSSDPLAKLRKPSTVVENPLLTDDELRRIIKANAITFNIDNPTWLHGNPRRINDTKAYLPTMGMGHLIYSLEDFQSSDFETYLRSQGINADQIASGNVHLRAKPMQASYGGYGHQRALLGNKKFLSDVKRGLYERGPYIIQLELQNPRLINITDGEKYTYIDRNFLTTDGRNYKFMGGFRSLMPLNTMEAHRGRVHGNVNTVWAEIAA